MNAADLMAFRIIGVMGLFAGSFFISYILLSVKNDKDAREDKKTYLASEEFCEALLAQGQLEKAFRNMERNKEYEI